jgi:hypothetical protein
MIDSLDLLAEKRGHLASFLPPPSLFYGLQPIRLAEYVACTIKLLPTLLLRPTLARSDSTILRLTAKQWREVLGGRYWRSFWPASEQPSFSMDGDFWKFGGPEIFGKTLSEAIRQGSSSFVPANLQCGCAATIEKIKGDDQVFGSVVASLNQWALLHQFSALAQDALGKAGVEFVKDGPNQHRTPDFYKTDRNATDPVTRLIKKIVLNGVDIPASGWPNIWSGLHETDLKKRRAWIGALRDFFLKYADQRERFETMGPNWPNRNTLQAAQLASLDHPRLDNEQQAYLERYFASCLMAGDWPVELIDDAPDGWVTLEAVKCQECRIARFAEGEDPFALSTESDD